MADDRVGEQLGNYRLIRLIGRGGFAEVYLGEHTRLNTEAAIKVLHTRLESEDVDNFQREAKTIARLAHPNIVRVFDFAVQDGTPFLAMDYAPNGTLRQRHTKRAPLPLETIIPYLQQMADALAYAHEQKLVHRDIKPENMLVGRLNDILLSDFGIAVVAQSSRLQGMQEMVGTVGYMAPEQIQGNPRPASDQYSLGIVVYEWLSGQRPFNGGITEVATQHLVLPPPSLRTKNPAIPAAVEEVVMTALEKDPGKRFTNTRAFAAALENAAKQPEANIYSLSTQAMPLAPPPAAPQANTPSSPKTPPQSSGLRVGPPAGMPPSSGAVTPASLADLPTIAGSLPSSGVGWSESAGTLPASGRLWSNPSGGVATPPGAVGSGPQRVGSGPGGVGGAAFFNQPPGVFAPPVSGPVQASPPPAAPGAPAPRPIWRRPLMIVLAAILVFLLLSGGGVAAFFLLTQAHPVITITSDYAGSPLGGPPDTVLHVHGQQFSSNSTITFLLDGDRAPGSQLIESDGNGNVSADVTITDDWTFGAHTFTAKDARGFVTQQGVSITVIPQPVLTVMSSYMVGTTLAGSTSTSFTISGKRFAPNATVMFLLDGTLAPDSQPVQSDARGRVQVNLTVTGTWPLGSHTLTAQDNQGNTTKMGTSVMIVHQGEANTPGPNGAPPDDAMFTIFVTVTRQDASTGQKLDPRTFTLTVQNGKVCDVQNDTGKPQTTTFPVTDINTGKTLGTATETFTLTCSGTYQTGKLTYTETDTNDTLQLSDGGFCVVSTPRVNIHLEGNFSSASSINGSFKAAAANINCPRVNTFTLVSGDAQKGTWTGTA